jgi:hypothetical protein
MVDGAATGHTIKAPLEVLRRLSPEILAVSRWGGYDFWPDPFSPCPLPFPTYKCLGVLKVLRTFTFDQIPITGTFP